ncbi:MAG: AAA family ATPase [Chloroflexota bacterium]
MIEHVCTIHPSFTQQLGIQGWSHLDPVLLASLATESPLLLIGPHGTGKSLLIERLSDALYVIMRHYNAALINYDDIVGIPLLNEAGTKLEFHRTEATIWDAEFVFLDEISRCRPDMQNKLFPIIHERRVLGMKLKSLRHRWAAMNPPMPDTLDHVASPAKMYYGSEPLDPALTDRFPFIIAVPHWGELSREARIEIVLSEPNAYQSTLVDLPALVGQCVDLIPSLREDIKSWLGDYVISAIDLLEQAQLEQSPRRANMLAQAIIAVHAARCVLIGADADPEISAELALTYCIPQTASEVPPSRLKLVAIHRQAWERAALAEDDSWRIVLEEYDPARRVALADSMGFSDADLSRLITQTISKEPSDARQVGLATAMFLAFSPRRNLDASAYEPLAQLANYVLAPRNINTGFPPNSQEASLWKEIKEWIENQWDRAESFRFRLERNYLLHGMPKLWQSTNWQEALHTFREDCGLFGIQEAE